MLQPVEAMKIALSVLTALTERNYPDFSEIKALRDYAPKLQDLPPDELACEVIQHVLQERGLAQTASKSLAR